MLALQLAQQVDDLHLHRHVERRGGLVQHHETRAQHHGAGDGDALALPAREFVRIAVHRGGVETDLVHHLGHEVAVVAAVGRAVHAQPLGDDLLAGHAGREAAVRVLEDDLHFRAQLAQAAGGPVAHVLAAEGDRALGLDQAHDRQRQRGLARSAFAHDAHRLARADGDAGVVDGLHVAHGALEQALLDREPDAQVVGAGDGLGVVADRVRHAGAFGRQQHLRVGMLRVGEDLGRGAGFDDLAVLHHADAVGDAAHDPEVVGDEQQA